MANGTTQQATGWAGWVYFAGILLIVSGVLQMIAGLTALLNDAFFAVSEEALLVFDFTTWGWGHLLIGMFLLLTGTSVMGGHLWARIVAVFLAAVNMFAQFAFLEAYPVWSIIAILIDVVIIYALTVHAGELRA